MSEIKVNKISPRTNCGTTQLGDSGDTITIPAGVSITNSGTASGFGATGSASWVTTVKTSGFTAVAGEGYFVNTTGGAVSINLPAGTAGDVVAIKDYANTFDTNGVTLVQNGSDKIGGSTVNAVLTEEGIAVTLVFIDSTRGWLVTDSGLQSEVPEPKFVTATGGTITTVCTNYKVHTFTGPGTFTVSCAGNCAGSNSVDYLVIAGGAGGGNGSSAGGYGAGGGGAGGYRESGGTASGCYARTPLGACVSALPVTATGYPVTVGGGGSVPGSDESVGGGGSNSVFTGSSTITSAGGGGGGGTYQGPQKFGNAGGSGGGGGSGGQYSPSTPIVGGAGNTPPVSPPQGNAGGTGSPCGGKPGGGGGGATAVGTNAPTAGTPPNPATSTGGAGGTSTINGTPTARAGGGGAGGLGVGGGSGGSGGGGAGGPTSSSNGVAGTTNTGGGGGGASGGTGIRGGAGGSGIVVIRYKFQ
jgi:hypothetical protein